MKSHNLVMELTVETPDEVTTQDVISLLWSDIRYIFPEDTKVEVQLVKEKQHHA